MRAASRETSGITTRLVLEFVRARGGDALVERVLDRAGLDHPEAVLLDESRWFSFEDRVALLEAASEVIGDPGVARRIGASILDLRVGRPLQVLIQTLGSPVLLVRNLPRVAAKFSTCDTLEIVDVGRSHAVIEYRLERHAPSWVNCEYALGLLTQLGPVFGLPVSAADHASCAALGDARCVWRVSWGRWSRLPWRRAAAGRSVRLQAVTEQLAMLQHSLAELVSARNARSALPGIAHHAAVAVQAQRHLLAVSTENDEPIVIHDGFEDSEVAQLVDRFLRPGRDEQVRAGDVMARVVSSRRDYGFLLCAAPRNAPLLPEEQRLIDAYARQAAVALELSATVEERRRKEHTARALFHLAGKLAAARHTEEVAQCLASTVPDLVGAAASAVLVIDRDAGVLRVVAASGWPDELADAVLGFEVGLDAAPVVTDFVADPTPYHVDANVGEPLIAAVLEAFDTDGAMVVPIVAHDELLGIVAAVRRGTSSQLTPEEMIDPLQGVADVAATAFESARLLEARQAALVAAEERERELREARGMLAHIIDSGPIVTFRGTTDGFRITYVSQNVQRIFGYDPDTFLGQRWLDFVHVEDAERVWGDVQRIETEDEVGFAMRFRAVTGEFRTLQVFLRGLDTADGSGREVLGYVWDQTERMEAEAALRASEERFRRLVQDSPLAIQAHDPDGRVILWNPACEALFGWASDEVLGGPPPTIEDAADFDDVRRVLVEGTPVTNYETRLRRKDRTFVDVAMSAAPMRDGDGECAGTIVVLADITERRRLEEELLQAQKMNALGRLAGGVAHDFNNLLTAILGHADLLVEAPDDPFEVTENAAAIGAAGKRAAALTQQMLMFSRHQTPDAGVLDVNEVVRSIHEMLARIIGEDVEMRVEAQANPATVRAVRTQLEQVILNLVVNARDAMPQGGVVTIATHTVSDGVSSAWVSLTVRDTGVGMSAEVRERAFEPFFTTKGQGEGTGLGLSVVYGIVTNAGGHVQIDATPGGGTSVEIRLPLVEGVVASERDADAGGAGSVEGNEVVLLVEDEPAVRALARRTLERAGYAVAEAPDAAAALELAHGTPVDLLVTDVVMPHVGGPELAKRLADDHPALRVLFISGYSEQDLWDHGGDASANFLQKPFSPVQLLQAVRSALDT